MDPGILPAFQLNKFQLADIPPLVILGICMKTHKAFVVIHLLALCSRRNQMKWVSPEYGVYALLGSFLLTMMGVSLMFEKNLIRLGNVSLAVNKTTKYPQKTLLVATIKIVFV